MNKAGEPLFPERYNLAQLKRKRQELRSEARFAREFMCKPLTDEASLFPSHLFEGSDVRVPYKLGLGAAYWDQQHAIRYTGVDIAMSAETGGDYFVIFTVAVQPDGTRWVVNITREKGWGFQRQIDAIKDEYYRLRPEVIHIEANQMQRVWSDEIIRTTGLPVRKFFTTGVGGAQPLQPWRRGATSIAVNKNHIDRGVPGMRLSLENRKWRIPRGDEEAIEKTDLWIGEMGSMGWIDGKVQSVGEHDDLVMACWMCHAAIERGNPLMEVLEVDRTKPPAPVLAAPRPPQAEGPEDELLAAERAALAAIQGGQPVGDINPEMYVQRIRRAMHDYAGQMVDCGEHQRATIALQEIKRLDSLFRVRSADMDTAESGGYGGGRESWKAAESSPTMEDLGIYPPER